MIAALVPQRGSWSGWVSFALRAAATGVVLRRVAGAATADDPIAAPPGAPAAASSPVAAPESGDVTVVVPARDEVERIGPLLERIVAAPGVAEVIVVDDESSDGTAALAARLGARVLSGTTPPDRPGGGRWAGKAWALQQGIEAATTTWVVTLDADTRPAPALAQAAVARAAADGYDVLTLAGRFECPTPGVAWLHPAMLTTLVYRFGPPGGLVDARRGLANGQCMVLRREQFLADGGMAPVAGEVVEDVALARAAAARGRRVGFLDAAELLEVRMFESLPDAWSGWGRSLALPGVEPRGRQVVDVALLAAVQLAPLLRVARRRVDLVDVVALAGRLGTLVGTRRAYRLAGLVDRAAYWASPLADPAALVALICGIARGRRQTWRGRSYG